MKTKFVILLVCIIMTNPFSVKCLAQSNNPTLYGAAMKLWETGDISIGSLSKGGIGINIQASGYTYFCSSLFGKYMDYNLVVANNDYGFANTVYRYPYERVSWDRGDGYRYARKGFGTRAVGPEMKNISTIVDPLEIISVIRGVSYDIVDPPDSTINPEQRISKNFVNGTRIKSRNRLDSLNSTNSSQRTKCFGFIPTELLDVVPEAVERISESDEEYSINYDIFIPFLVEGIKELERQIFEIRNGSSLIKSTTNENEMDEPHAPALFQNLPNPFTSQTKIKYFLTPKTIEASILIFNMEGELIKEFSNLCCKSTFIIINENELKPGMYMYTLVADGKEIDTKRLILTK